MFCWHKWSLPIGNTNQQVCEKCGKFTTIPCFHKFGTPIDNRQTCEKCGEVKVIQCNHIWEEQDITYVGAVRDIDGKIREWTNRKVRFKCKFCGEQKVKYI